MLFDTAFVGRRPEDALAFIVEILQSSTEYSLIGKGLDGTILLWNEGARRLYGYEAEEVLGTAHSAILHPPEDIAAGLPTVMMEEAVRLGKWEGLLTRVRKSGQRFLARATLTPRFDTTGEHTGYLLVSKDVTHEVALSEELVRKTDELTSTNNRLSALIELSLQLGSELDLRKLLQGFGHAAREIIGARYSVAGILDAEGSRFQSLYASGLDAETAARLGSPDPRSGVVRTVLREGRCVRVQNPGGDPAALGFSSSRPPIHSWLGAPIASPTRVFGYIGLVDKVGLDEFSQEDERLAGILAAQVGRVYQNGSLYADALRHASDLEREMAAHERTEKDLAERVRQGILTGEVGAALTRSDTLQGMLQLCAQALVRHLDVVFARIWTLNEAENVLELKASAGLHTHIDGAHSRIPMGELAIGRIAQERAPYFTNDVLADPQVSDKEWAKRENLVAFAGYPLLVEDRLVGVVGMFARQPLNGPTLDAIGSVADEIALGVERFRANEALRRREEHIRLLLDSSAEAIYGIDLQGCCTFANSACARFLGYDDPSHLLGRNMHALMHHSRPDGSPYPVEECKIFQAFLQNQGSHVDDEVLWRANGSCFPAEYWSYPFCREGQVVGSVVTFLDITERKQAEEEQSKLREQLQQAQKMESIGRLAGGVAHDFNNLLTVINGHCDLLLKELMTGDPMHESIAEIRQVGQRATELVRQLLLLSRKQVTQASEVNLNDIITEVGKMLARVIGEDIRLEFDLSPSLGWVLADPGQLHQILMNLAVNARDAMPGGGTLLIETRNVNLEESYPQHANVKPGPYVLLSVIDTGIGMTSDVIAHIYEPFFSTKKPGEGTGLGLSTVYGIVQLSGGSIWVYSEPGEGTTFTIYLPRIADPEHPRQAAEPASELLGSPRPAGTILVVDDEPEVRSFICKVLTGVSYQVLEAENGKEAAQRIETTQVDLVIMDLAMPEQEGIETIRALHDVHPQLKIIAISGRFAGLMLHVAEVFGAHASLAKPIEPDELLAAVARVMLGSSEEI